MRGSQVSPSKNLFIVFYSRSGGNSIQTQWIWGSCQNLRFGESVYLKKVGQSLPGLTQEIMWKIWLVGELDRVVQQPVGGGT